MTKEDSLKKIENLPQNFERTLNWDQKMFLKKFVLEKYGLNFDETLITKLEGLMKHLDKYMTGRLAADSVDLIVVFLYRYIASSLLENKKKRAHVEIGTLFGGSAVISMKAMELARSESEYIMIDPLDSYYDNSTDRVTGLEINEKYVLKNLERYKLENANYKIIKHLSNDLNALNKMSGKKVLSLYIDGDHSYDGVRNDWYNYSPLVVDGGFVIIDNYNDRFWPEITQFVNNELINNLNNEWSIDLTFGKTIVLKKEAKEFGQRLNINRDMKVLEFEVKSLRGIIEREIADDDKQQKLLTNGKILQLEQDNRSLGTDNEIYKQRLKALETEVKTLEGENRLLMSQIEGRQLLDKDEFRQIRQDLQDSASREGQLRAQLDKKTSELDAAKNENIELEKSISKIEANIEILNRELEKKSEFEKKIHELQLIINRKDSELAEKENDIKAHENKLIKAEDKCSNTEKDISRLKNQIDKLKGETETKIAALEAQKEKIEQEKADLERKKNAEFNTVKAENNDLVKKLQGIERNVELLGRELEKFDKLKKAVGEICEAHHIKTPLRKLKAYKRMIDLYWEIV